MKLDQNKLFTIEAEGNYGGDKIEKHGWPLFGKEKFPNYEKFWQLFVVPKTNRPSDIHYSSSKTNLEERAVGSIHYAIFQNFNYIYSSLKTGLSEESFELSFIKLSNNCDLVEELLFRILIYCKKETIENVISGVKLKKPKLESDKTIKNDLNKKGSYTIAIINRIEIIKKHFEFSKYLTLSGRIRNYRNTIAHSWQSFQVNDLVPKVEFVQEYKDWIKVTDIVKSGNQDQISKMVTSQYTKRDELISGYADQLITIINIIWVVLIDFISSQDFDEFSTKGFAQKINNLTIGDPASYADTTPVNTTTSSGICSVQMSAGMRTPHDR